MWTIIYSTLEAPQGSTEQDSTVMNPCQIMIELTC